MSQFVTKCVFAFILLTPLSAWACCTPTNDNDNNNYNNNTTTSTATSTSDSNSNSSASVGDVGGGNASVVVNSGGGSGGNGRRTIFIPAVVPSSPAAAIGVGDVTALVGTCGPLQRVVHTPVSGTYVGIFKKSHIDQGFDDTLEPYIVDGVQRDYREVHMPDGSTKLMGHQPLTFVSVIGVAAARNIALGGGSGGGSWGQAGGGSSSSMQQLVTRIQLRDCEVGTVYAAPVSVPSTSRRVTQ